MRFAEILYDTGMINRENLRGARAEDIYILKGEGEEIYRAALHLSWVPLR